MFKVCTVCSGVVITIWCIKYKIPDPVGGITRLSVGVIAWKQKALWRWREIFQSSRDKLPTSVKQNPPSWSFLNQVLPSDLFGCFKWPFQGLSDLHLGDQKVTWKKLEGSEISGIRETKGICLSSKTAHRSKYLQCDSQNWSFPQSAPSNQHATMGLVPGTPRPTIYKRLAINWMIPNLYIENGWKSPNIHL